MRVLVTGATGFVGKALVTRLVGDRRMAVRAAVRRASSEVPAAAERMVAGDLRPDADWFPSLAGVDAVVHLAARVHVMHDEAARPLEAFRYVNVAGTLNLARQAARAGARRFVFLSSVKVHGESGICSETATLAPKDPYGLSKYEAEIGLHQIGLETGLQIVIVRPPLVYGPGVKANFHALTRAVARGIPLPFGAVRNQRSLVGLDNLVDFIVACIDNPAADETFLVSDGEDLSTADLIRRLARAMGRPARLIPVPASLLMFGASLLGQRDVAQRLLGSLQVDISKARRVLGWTPPISVDEGLRRAVSIQGIDNVVNC